MDHNFTGPPFTVGVEEELMIMDAESLELAQEIEAILDAVPPNAAGQVKPELMQSVLEIATDPCPDVAAAERQLRTLRRQVTEIAAERGLAIGASGTHPIARWEDQAIVERPRYLELADELGYVARRELIFGTHVHVGVDDPDKAIYVADGTRRYLPLMLAMSANSPLWRGQVTGMMSSRTPVFRAFPRVGIPPHYGTWEAYEKRVELMVESGAIDDYSYLWWDVRAHPNLGTVETRVFDQQTRVEYTVAFAALVQSLVHRLCAEYDDGRPMVEDPGELIDDNKVRAALNGLEGDLVDFAYSRPKPAAQMTRDLIAELREHAEQLGCAEELSRIEELLEHGTGARRQLEVYERELDLHALVRQLCERSGG
jgi:glutamate---cysteine ligase / carboxylate-amine ligase